MMYDSIIYPKVVAYCHLRKMSIAQLAEKCNMGYATLRKKLQGLSSLTLDEAIYIRDKLECRLTIDDLFVKGDFR